MANRANDTPLSFTRREMQSLARRPQFWAVLVGVIAVLSLTGPFDTYGRLSLPARTAYWAAVGAGSFGLGMTCSMLAACWAEDAGLRARPATVLGAIVAGLPVAILNGALHHLAFGSSLLATTWDILPYAIAISGIVAFLYELHAARDTDPIAPAAGAPAPAPPPTMLAKLPPHLGRDIVHLQAQDHYVKVTTPQGSALILMRIGDAERELSGLAGLRVHRSWWVSHRHAIRVLRRNGQDHVLTSLGLEIPIGRAYRKRALSTLRKPR